MPTIVYIYNKAERTYAYARKQRVELNRGRGMLGPGGKRVFVEGSLITRDRVGTHLRMVYIVAP